MPEMKEGFGTRLSEATQPCDLLNTIQQVPKSLRPKKVNDLEKVLAKIEPNLRGCERITATYCTFIDRKEFVKKPAFDEWLWVLKLNLGDMIIDLESMTEALCKDSKNKEVIEQLKQFKVSLAKMDFPSEEIQRINAEMRKEWKKDWIEANAWDYDEKELKMLKTPFDEEG